MAFTCRLLLWQQATAVAAGMLIARAEAAGAAHATGGPPSEVDKYKAALLMAVREKQVEKRKKGCAWFA
eukprot:1161360-Pelagomonas_calceolata.AAC.14